MPATVLGIGLFVSVVLLAGIHGVLLQSLASLLLLSWLLFTAFPISKKLLSNNRPYAAIFAFPLGYIFHSIILSLLSLLTPITTTTLVMYVILSTAAFLATRPRLSLPTIDRGLLVWLLITVALVWLPLAHIGAETERGFAYRAYFNADYFKHLSITGTLAQTGVPPENPYLFGYTLHYYWFFYIIPAYWTKLFRHFPPQFLFIQFTIVGTLSFVAALYCAVKEFTTSGKILPLLLPLFAFGGSYEALFGLKRLYSENQNWRALTTLNIDAATRWFWNTPQVDTLYRALLYAPQHLLALSLLLLWLIVRRKNLSLTAKALLYTAIFSTMGFATLIGIVFIFCVLLLLLLDFVRAPRDKYRELLLAAILGVTFLFIYFPVLQMFQTGEDTFDFGLVGRIWGHLPGYLILNWGVLLIFGIAGIFWTTTKFPRSILCLFLFISLLCMHYVKDKVGGSEVTLKLGYLADLSLLLLSAGFMDRFLTRFPKRLPLLAALVAFFTLPASLTWLVDAYNTQDVNNVNFTTYVARSDASAMKWMKENISDESPVQNYALEGQNMRASEIPTFAWRPVYLGDDFHAKAFQVPFSDVEERKRTVWSLFHSNDPVAISAMAQGQNIRYLYLGDYDTTVSDLRYELVPPYFSTVFAEDKTLLVKVNKVAVHFDPAQTQNFQIISRDEDGIPLVRADFDSGFYAGDGNVRSGFGRWLNREGKILMTSQEGMDGTLTFFAQSLGIPRHLQIFLDSRMILERQVPPQTVRISVSLPLKEGKNEIRVVCPEGPEQAGKYAKNGDPRLVSLRFKDVRFEPEPDKQ